MLPQFALTLLLCQAAWSLEINPGMKVQVSQKGLDYAKQIALDILKPLLPTIPIPDVHGSIYFAGNVVYEATQLQIMTSKISNMTLTFLSGSGIQVSISNSQATIEHNWKVDSWAIHRRGSSILSYSGISLIAVVAVGRSSTRIPSISLPSCSSDVEDVGVDLITGQSMFNNLIKLHMKRIAREKMNQMLCPMLNEQIQKWSKYLSTMPFQINLNEHIGFDYFLVSEPVITEEDLTLPLKGKFYSRGNREEMPFSPAPFSLPILKDDMLCIGASEFFFNSAMHTYFKSNAFTLNLDTLPPGSLDVMNTSALAEAFPKAAKQKHPVMGILKATKAPLVTLKPNNMTVAAALSAEVFTILPNSVKKLVAAFKIDAIIRANLFIQSSEASLLLIGSVTINRCQVHLVDTGTKDKTSVISTLENTIEKIVVQRLLKILNEHLRTGIQLPNLPYFTLTKPSFKIDKEFITICGDGELVTPQL